MVIMKIYFYEELISLFRNLYDYDFEMVEMRELILVLVFGSVILNARISSCRRLDGRSGLIIRGGVLGAGGRGLTGNACFLLSF
jgi:hypothetical protein